MHRSGELRAGIRLPENRWLHHGVAVATRPRSRQPGPVDVVEVRFPELTPMAHDHLLSDGDDASILAVQAGEDVVIWLLLML